MADRENNKVKCQKQEVTDYNLMKMVVLRMCGGGINRNIKVQVKRGQRKKRESKKPELKTHNECALKQTKLHQGQNSRGSVINTGQIKRSC